MAHRILRIAVHIRENCLENRASFRLERRDVRQEKTQIRVVIQALVQRGPVNGRDLVFAA